MARRRSTHRKLRALVSLGVLLAITLAVWFWPRGDAAPPDALPPVLTGTVGLDRSKPALERIVPPQKETPPPSARPSVEPPSVSPGLVEVPASRPASSRPATTPDLAGSEADFQAGLEAYLRSDLHTARIRLNRALLAGLPADRAKRARETLADLADRTVFTRAALEGDPLTGYYVVESGDTLVKIAKQLKLFEDFLAEVNGIANKNFIRQGMRLKVVHGPFHAAISKSDHLMHVYLQDVYVRSFRVALGVNGGTPTGRWKVVNHQENPSWVDPRTGKRWHADDPQNPIGEYWIGLEGTRGGAVGQFGYGIHGTIEPGSIGQDVSMGCVRLSPDDVALLYRLLVPGESFVTVSE